MWIISKLLKTKKHITNQDPPLYSLHWSQPHKPCSRATLPEAGKIYTIPAVTLWGIRVKFVPCPQWAISKCFQLIIGFYAQFLRTRYPSCRSFLNPSSHGLLTLFMGSKFLSSRPLQRLHVHKSHAWICPSVPPTGLETIKTAWSYPLPEGGWTTGIPLGNLIWRWVGPLCSDLQLDIFG